jgi:predicted cupin superfamily sugar epimerase
MDADEVLARFALEPHPEGGAFRETWRDEYSTAIYFLLRAGERSGWHRVDAVEIWHHYAGAPLELAIAPGGEPLATHRLGADLAAGEQPQLVVPAGAWQSARSLGAWTLVGCTVSPPFSFERFELASPGWEPPRGSSTLC